ncbi:MAG: hypothetical protein WA705_16235 [Candidatus Ozemobacteraceae bacterium]
MKKKVSTKKTKSTSSAVPEIKYSKETAAKPRIKEEKKSVKTAKSVKPTTLTKTKTSSVAGKARISLKTVKPTLSAKPTKGTKATGATKSIKAAKTAVSLKSPVAAKATKVIKDAAKQKPGKTKKTIPVVKTAPKKVVKSFPLATKAAKKTIRPTEEAKARLAKQIIASGTLIEKPWSVTRIHNFMRLWGMTQVEMAVFCGVSYDSVTSWSRGRRRLVRRVIADHLEAAEEAAHEREFPKGSSAVGGSSPWLTLRNFCRKSMKLGSFRALPKETVGTFPLLAVETFPRVVRRADRQECLRTKKIKGKDKDAFSVELIIGKKTYEFQGLRTSMGDCEVIALSTSEKDANFFNGRAGCITVAQNLVRISLWSPKNLPIRLIASS